MKKLRKITAIALAIIMVMSLGTTAFAAGPITAYHCEHDTDACYEMVLGCGKHVHDADCAAGEAPCALEEDRDLTCTEEEHTHGDNCYALHVHTAECMERGELICTLGDLPADLVTATRAESGIDFNLYNYNSNINLKYPVEGKAKTEDFTVLSQYFNFDGAGATNRTGTKDVGNLGKGHLTYEKNLGEDGAPVITWASVGNLDELAATEARSIGYVFGKTEHYGVTAYEDILNTPLTYDPDTGYYEYDSAKNAVDFDEESNKVYVRGYLERGDASANANVNFAADDSLADFFPFNSRIQGEPGEASFVEDSEECQIDGAYFHFDGTYSPKNLPDEKLEKIDYWFGASMDAEFYYPQNGRLNGEAMKYEFSGDDDVMVYIDGIYVLDLGGAHSRASGEIDFETGLVETWLDAANQTKLYPSGGLYDHKEWAADARAADALGQDADGFYYDTRSGEALLIGYYPTTIYECYKAAYEEQGLNPDAVAAKLAEVFVKIEGETVVDAYGNEHDVYRFRDYSVHTFNWFYLERHSWEANFYTKFNLPTIPQNSLTIEKVVEDSEGLVDDNALYAFEVWATDEDGAESEKIDTVKLNAGEKAVINDILNKVMAVDLGDHYGYVVKELGQYMGVNEDGTEIYSLEGYTTTWAGGGSAVPVEDSITTELSSETSQVVIFTNTVTAPPSSDNPPSGGGGGSTTSVTVVKVWDDDDDAAELRPESITVVLLENGDEYDTFELSESNNWEHTWRELSKESSWSVEEVEVDGYTSSVSVSGSSYTITNTLELYDIFEEDPPLADIPEEDPPLAEVPQTGDPSALWLTLSAVSGVVGLFGLNFGTKKRKAEEETEE